MARTKSVFPQLRFHSSSRRFYVFFDGKRQYLGYTKAEAEAAYKKLIVRLAEGKAAPEAPQTFNRNPGITVAEALLEFVRRELPRRFEPRKASRYRKAIDAAIAIHGSTPAAEFKSLALLQVRDHPAWKTMIQASSLHGGAAGCFRLVPPAEDC